MVIPNRRFQKTNSINFVEKNLVEYKNFVRSQMNISSIFFKKDLKQRFDFWEFQNGEDLRINSSKHLFGKLWNEDHLNISKRTL